MANTILEQGFKFKCSTPEGKPVWGVMIGGGRALVIWGEYPYAHARTEVPVDAQPILDNDPEIPQEIRCALRAVSYATM